LNIQTAAPQRAVEGECGNDDMPARTQRTVEDLKIFFSIFGLG